MTKNDLRFRILKQGYDRFEVDKTLDELENHIEDLKSKLSAYQNQIDYSNRQTQLANQRYQELLSQITIREKAADEISRLALKEANDIIETATNNADIIVREALSTARLLLVELARISNQTNVAKADLKERITQLNGLIEAFELPQVPNMEWLQKYNQKQ